MRAAITGGPLTFIVNMKDDQMSDTTATCHGPDGYQVIDITTGETVWHSAHEILSWEIASKVLEVYPANQHQIIAVTEAMVLDDEDVNEVDYLPQFLSFSLGSTQSIAENGDYITIMHNERPDSAESGAYSSDNDELCLNPRITRNLMLMLGLPMSLSHDGDQKVWSLDLVQDRIKDVHEKEKALGYDEDIRQGFEDLKWLVEQAEDSFTVDLLILDNNNFDSRLVKAQ